MDPDGTSFSGSARRNNNYNNIEFVWDVVKGKLLNLLSTTKEELDFGATPLEFEQNYERQPSNLCALAQGSRLRLLWASFQLLKKEAGSVSIIAL